MLANCKKRVITFRPKQNENARVMALYLHKFKKIYKPSNGLKKTA